eukprot:COSAG04_NODE_14985_length_547_cov_4.078125_1_plen_63_part_10
MLRQLLVVGAATESRLGGSGPVPRGALGCWEGGKDVPAAEPSALNAQRNPQGWAFEHSRPTLR